jgi:FkbM family methyltransferase
MKITPRVRFLNFFRIIFKVPFLEKFLSTLTQGKSPNHFFSKFVPNPYQYPANSYRQIHLSGIQMTIDISDYLGHCLYFGIDGKERQSHKHLFALVSNGYDILDIGSNIGFTVLSMAQLSIKGKVIGFEPDRLNYERCLININQNNFGNINLYNIGLGSEDMSIPMEVRTEFNRGGNRVALNGKGEIIEVKKLDNLFPSLNISKVDLVKIDVEGYELHVLQGAKKLLQQFKPTLFIELSDDNLRYHGGSAKELIEFLVRTGYSSIVKADSNFEIKTDFNFKNCHFDIIAH